MKFVVHELRADGISQIVTPTKNVVIEAIRPHIYRHNFAAGSLKLQILDQSAVVIAESVAVNISAIGTMNYFHGYVRFYINAYLAKDVSYTLKLVGQDGYTFAEAAYCGWVNGLDLAKYDNVATPVADFYYPLDYEMWERTVK